eukprot:4636280-Pyramimonas_sp.AAC.1
MPPEGPVGVLAETRPDGGGEVVVSHILPSGQAISRDPCDEGAWAASAQGARRVGRQTMSKLPSL